jgi:hypothetical protein
MDQHAASILVGQALDDLESGRLDAPTALGMVAEYAWSAGYRACRDDEDPHPPERIPEPGSRRRLAAPAPAAPR